MDSKEIGAVVRQAREAMKLSQAELGSRVGIKQASIQSIERGDTARSKFLPEIARMLNIPPEKVGLPSTDVLSAVPSPDFHRARRGPQDVPLLGITVGGEKDDDDDRDPDFWINGEVVDYVTRPSGIAQAKNVFSLYVSGESMFPRFRERDLVYVQKTNPAGGDDVVIELHPASDGGGHPSFIKEFVRRRGSYIVVKQYNPPKELEFEVSEIKDMFRVLTLKDLLG